MKHQNDSEAQFAICIKNDRNPASLELRKIYQVMPGTQAAERQLIRAIDESGEDSLYSADRFVPIESPEAAAEAFSLAA